MAFMAIKNKQNRSAIIILSEDIYLQHKYVLELHDSNLIAGPAIWAANIVPGANLLKLSKKPLGLEVLPLENDTRVEIYTRGCDGVDYRDP